MSGKKVFTAAGEKLATFLLSVKKDATQEQTLTDTLADINNSNVVNSLTKYQDAKIFNKTDVISFFKREIQKELGFVKVTDSQKELTLQKMTQLLYNSTKRLSTLTEAQFQALTELVVDNLADIFKTLGIQERKFTRLVQKLSNDINNIRYFDLDYFMGDEDYKARLKNSGNNE